MDMYPYVETLKVGAAYAVLLYIWPCILFRSVLRNKGLTFRFIFCSMVQPVLLSTVVITLGFFHVLNLWIVRTLFWGALAISLLSPLCRWQRQSGERLPLRALITQSYGWKLFFSRIAEVLMQRWEKNWQPNWRKYRKITVEYLVLTAILLFGMAFFINGVFQDYSFGCSDQYTHYRWTSALLQGEIFAEGIYPEGMHCFLYALHVLFGVKLYSCVVFLAGIHNSSVFLLAAYCLLKELFRSRHIPLFVLTAWLVFEGIGPSALESMNRMTWTLPQEFALYLVFLCPLVLLRYFREQNKPEKWYRDENLLFLMAGVAFAVSTHFYVLIMAFCSCCAVLLIHYREFWHVRRMLALVCAVLYGLELGVLPMLAAYAIGMNLEGSLLWGLSILRGAGDSSAGFADLTAVSYFTQVCVVLLVLLSLFAAVYVYARRRGKFQAMSVASVLGNTHWQGKFQSTVLDARMAEGYLTLVAGLTVFVFLYAMPYIGLPELVAVDRTMCVTKMFVFGVAGILLDLLILRMERLWGMLPRRWTALGCLILYLFAYMTDFHQCTYRYLQRYNAAVTVTDQIMNHYPEWAYRIVSMFDEAYQAGWGSQEELLTFLDNTEGEDYFIPVEYIFLYVEKHPLLRWQVHFPTAPRWLAQDNYEVYKGLWTQSQCPDILHGEISQEMAMKEIAYYPVIDDKYYNYSDYDDLTARIILYSKIYNWYQEFSAIHPAETNVYYEDDDFVCYVIHQDQAAPLQLATGRREGK